jgi:hypothetical protein
MADNTVLNPGVGGDTTRTIDRGAAKTQVVQEDIGGEAGPESLVSLTNPKPNLIADFSVALRRAFTRALNDQVASENNGGRIRVVLDAGPGAQTLGTVTTVGTVTNVSNLVAVGPANAGIPIRDALITPIERNTWANTVRRCIT